MQTLLDLFETSSSLFSPSSTGSSSRSITSSNIGRSNARSAGCEKSHDVPATEVSCDTKIKTLRRFSGAKRQFTLTLVATYGSGRTSCHGRLTWPSWCWVIPRKSSSCRRIRAGTFVRVVHRSTPRPFLRRIFGHGGLPDRISAKTADSQFLGHFHEVVEQRRRNVGFSFVDKVEHAFEEFGRRLGHDEHLRSFLRGREENTFKEGARRGEEHLVRPEVAAAAMHRHVAEVVPGPQVLDLAEHVVRVVLPLEIVALVAVHRQENQFLLVGLVDHRFARDDWTSSGRQLTWSRRRTKPRLL